MNIALMGFGTVGRGVYKILSQRDDITVKRVLEIREAPEIAHIQTKNIDDILTDKTIDTVVEVMGGLRPASDFVLRALQAGKNVVTANKLMLSYHYAEFRKAARENGVQIRFDACVGGGIPYLHNLARTASVDTINAVYGIVNGTTNYILDQMHVCGTGFDTALKQAQQAGYAEADPTADIDGIDARSKICLMASGAFSAEFNPEEILTCGIRNVTAADIACAEAKGCVVKLIARAERTEKGYCLTVEPTFVSKNAPEASVHTNNNLITYEGKYIGVQSLYGQGAGQDPTATAVVLGLIDIKDNIGIDLDSPAALRKLDYTDAKRRYYVRDAQGSVTVTEPVSVYDMHSKAKAESLFFARVAEGE